MTVYTQKDLIYHRGRHGLVERFGRFVPVEENSLSSFIIAAYQCASMVECDVREHPLGPAHDPVICHDAFAPEAGPTIIEVLDTLNADCSVNIEIKDRSATKRTLEILSWYLEYGGWGYQQFVLSSFDHPTLVDIKKHHPQLTVAAIMETIPLLPYITMLRKKGVDNIHLAHESADMDMRNGSALMRHATKLGMQMWVYTVNDLATAKRMYDWGAKRIFTDRPQLFPT